MGRECLKVIKPTVLLLSSLVIAGCDNAQDTSTAQSAEKQTLTIEHFKGQLKSLHIHKKWL